MIEANTVPIFQDPHVCTRHQQSLSRHMDLTPGRRHLQQEHVVPQKMRDLPIGIRAPVGTKRTQ
jgi:hypothetical protein